MVDRVVAPLRQRPQRVLGRCRCRDPLRRGTEVADGVVSLREGEVRGQPSPREHGPRRASFPSQGTVAAPRVGTGTHQVGGNARADQEAHIDVGGVAAVLGDLGQAADAGSNGKGEDQDGLEEFGAVRDDGIEIHLVAAEAGQEQAVSRGSWHRHPLPSQHRSFPPPQTLAMQRALGYTWNCKCLRVHR